MTTLYSEYEDAINTKCQDMTSGRDIFTDVIFFVHPPPEDDASKVESNTKFSIVLFIIDSASQMAFRRNLPQTLDFAKSLGGDMFLGHHKVGSNSNPNVAGLLGENCSVTQKYLELGWHPLLLEDSQFQGEAAGKGVCKGYDGENYNEAVHLIDHRTVTGNPNHSSPILVARDFIKAYSHLPTFLHLHLSEYSHEALGTSWNYDLQLLEMLKEVSAAGALNNTFFMLLGDHGFRFGSFVETEQGNIEDNMPGMVIIPPVGLQEDLVTNLIRNREVLTSHYDVQHTLRHLLALSVDQPIERLFPGPGRPPGASLLTPLHMRSCTEAGVPLDFCSCPKGQLSLAPHTLLPVVESVFADLDHFLQPLWGCHQLRGKVANVTRTRVKREDGLVMVEALVRLTIQPVEFNIRVKFLENMREVAASLTRLDMYSATSHCVPTSDTIARPLCICQDQKHQSTNNSNL